MPADLPRCGLRGSSGWWSRARRRAMWPRMQAAAALAAALVPDRAAAGLKRSPAFTGRVNLNAAGPGLVQLDAGCDSAVNRVDPALTLATVAP